MENPKLRESIDDLRLAIRSYAAGSRGPSRDRRLAFLALSKAFEVALEYCWKTLKIRVVEEGLDPQSPKAAVRDAGRTGMIDNVDQWLRYIDARNSGVHDDFSLPEKDYAAIAAAFLEDAEKLAKTNPDYP